MEDARRGDAIEVGTALRAVNQRLRDGIRDLDDPPGSVAFVCECSQPGCRSTVEVPLDHFDDVSRHGHRFILVGDHGRPDVDRVVQEHRNYVVVERGPDARVS